MNETDRPSSPTRRGVMGAVLGAGIAGATAADGKAARRVPMRFDDPVWNRESNARLEADTDGSQVYGRCSASRCSAPSASCARRTAATNA
jgi:hypothetical protein